MCHLNRPSNRSAAGLGLCNVTAGKERIGKVQEVFYHILIYH